MCIPSDGEHVMRRRTPTPTHPGAPAVRRRITRQRQPHTAPCGYTQVTPAAVPRCPVTSCFGRISANRTTSARTPNPTNSTARPDRTKRSTATTASERSTRDSGAPVARLSAVRSRARRCSRAVPVAGATTERVSIAIVARSWAPSQVARSTAGPAGTDRSGGRLRSDCHCSGDTTSFTGIADAERRPVPSQATALTRSLLEHSRFDSATGYSRRTRAGAASPAVKHVGVSPTCRHTRPTRS